VAKKKCAKSCCTC